MKTPQTGQALVEVLAALLLLVPMLLAIQAIVELQATAAQATQTARLLAMASSLAGRSVRTDALLAEAPRLFDVGVAPARWSGSTAHAAEPREAVNATRVVSAALLPAELLAGRRLPLERNGWVVARAWRATEPQPLIRDVIGAGPLRIESRMSVLTEDAQAIGRDEVLQRTSSLDAMQPMRRVLRAIRPVTALLQLLDPPFRTLCAKQPDPDVLPADRLSRVIPSAAACL